MDTLTLGMNAIYVDSKGHQKAAFIAATSDSIKNDSRMESLTEGYFNIFVYTPTGRLYFREGVPGFETAADIPDYTIDGELRSCLYPVNYTIPVVEPKAEATETPTEA